MAMAAAAVRAKFNDKAGMWKEERRRCPGSCPDGCEGKGPGRFISMEASLRTPAHVRHGVHQKRVKEILYSPPPSRLCLCDVKSVNQVRNKMSGGRAGARITVGVEILRCYKLHCKYK